MSTGIGLKAIFTGTVPFFPFGKNLVVEVDLCTLFKSIECCTVMCELSTLCQKSKFDTDSPAPQKHIHQVSQKCQTFYLSVWATLPWLMVWWSSLTVPHHSLSYASINLHTIWNITNNNILKNDSQYPLAIQVNNFLSLKGGSKTETDCNREGGREMCQRYFLYWHLWLRSFEKMGGCLPACVCVCLKNRSCVEYLMHVTAAVASIGNVCIQRPNKPRSQGKGVIGKDLGCQHCLYTYLSIVTHTGLNMNTLETCFHVLPFFFVYLPFPESIQLSLHPSATF